MNYSSGAGVAVDLVQAHKWFNIAAMRGHQDGARLRREIAEQMADAEIGRAQRAARDWLKAHPQAPVEAPAIRAAA
jgi:TPR repeat protein